MKRSWEQTLARNVSALETTPPPLKGVSEQLLAGIPEALIITTPVDQPAFERIAYAVHAPERYGVVGVP
jgi:hypothetical protein